MLLRAGLLYILAVASLLLGVLAGWQAVQLSNMREDLVVVADRTARMQRALDDARVDSEATLRRALVAEDKLSRLGILGAGAAVATTASVPAPSPTDEFERVRRELDDAARERDAARLEAQLLAQEVAAARDSKPQTTAEAEGSPDDARAQVEKLTGELETAQKALTEAKSAMQERDAARDQSLQLTKDLEATRKALTEAEAIAKDRDQQSKRVAELAADLEAARAQVRTLTSALDVAKTSLADAKEVARETEMSAAAKDLPSQAKAEEPSQSTARSKAEPERSLEVTAASPDAKPSDPAPALTVEPSAQAPVQSSRREVKSKVTNKRQEPVDVPEKTVLEQAGDAIGQILPLAPLENKKTPKPKPKVRKEAKERQLDSSIILPF